MAVEPPPRFRLRLPADAGAPPPAPPPPEPPAPGGLVGLVEAVVRWLMGIETWKRAGIAVLLGTTTLVGYLVFTNEDRVFDALDALLRPHPVAHTAVLRARWDLERLCHELLLSLQPDALGVTIWSVDLLANTETWEADEVVESLRPVVAKYEKTRWANPLPLFIDNPHVNLLIADAIRGHVACDEARLLWPVARSLPQMA